MKLTLCPCPCLFQLLWMGMGMAFVGQIRDGEFKRWLHYQVYTLSFQILGGVLSAVIKYHNPQNRPKQGICVANHTSPIDVLVLACDNAYALVSFGNWCSVEQIHFCATRQNH